MRLPEAMTSAEVGAYIRGLREHFKLSALDISERLHIRVRYVTAIEENRYDQLPGKIYARGYVHTYAEFLGLDANQVVTLCFGAEEAAPAPVFKAPPPVRHNYFAANWWGIGLIAAAALFLLVLMSLFTSSDMPGDSENIVAPVPEEILETVRDSLMPTAKNRDCLMGRTLLSCFFADAPMQDIMKLQVPPPSPLSDLDMADPLAKDAVADEMNEEALMDEEAVKPAREKAKPRHATTETHKPPAKHDEKKHAKSADDAF